MNDTPPGATTPPEAPRFRWPVRILICLVLFHMIFRTTTILYPSEDWLEELDVARMPRGLPTRARLARLCKDAGSNQPALDEFKECGVSLARYWNPKPTEQTEKHLTSPVEWGKYVLVWTASRLRWCESIFAIDQEWAMFSPSVARRKPMSRARLRFHDGSEITVPSRSEPADFTSYLRFGENKTLGLDRFVFSDHPNRRDGCPALCNWLTHQTPMNDAGSPLAAILLYEFKVDFVPPGAEPHAFLREQARRVRDHRAEGVSRTFYIYLPDTKRGTFIRYHKDGTPEQQNESIAAILAATQQTLMNEPHYSSAWNRFWHAPVRAERLALMRILVGIAVLTQQFLEYLPNLAEFYGPEGIAPEGLLDEPQLDYWYWTLLIFNTDDMTTLRWVFAGWTVLALAFTLGFWTRTVNVALWLVTMAWLARNYFLLDGGDDVLQIAIFLLMLAPSGQALSIDAWLRRRRGLVQSPAFTVAWPLRLIQIQLCMIYCTTGLVKLGISWDGDEWWFSSWWAGTSIHYALNYLPMSTYSYASLPVPIWITAPMTWMSVAWEVFFPLLACFRRTRYWALAFGILFHIGIWVTLAIGWFGFYMIALYAVWIPDEWWARRDTRI